MHSPSVADLTKLSVQQRLRLLEELWDTLLADPDLIDITDCHRTILDKRLAAHRAEPDKGTPWEEVRQRLSD